MMGIKYELVRVCVGVGRGKGGVEFGVFVMFRWDVDVGGRFFVLYLSFAYSLPI